LPYPSKPTALHVLEGTFRTTRHKGRKREPKPAGVLSGPPEWMDREHKEVWRQQLRGVPAGMLKSLDGKTMAIWTCAVVAHERAARMLNGEGTYSQVVIPSKEGVLAIVNPFLGVMNRQAAIMIKAGSELGFSPVARTRIAVEGLGAAKSDPVDEFFDD
jgi:P27 family predicted phage terminase small subunit